MKEAPTGGTGLSAGERGARYRFWEVRGRWAMGRLLARADWSPTAFFHPFFLFLLFPFFVFYFLLYLLQNDFKTTQTKTKIF
jgi:hypothetical protein